jgi:hypothetical protein
LVYPLQALAYIERAVCVVVPKGYFCNLYG